MNTTQLPFLVEGILIVTAGIFGALLGSAGKPYGKVKLVIHLFGNLRKHQTNMTIGCAILNMESKVLLARRCLVLRF